MDTDEEQDTGSSATDALEMSIAGAMARQYNADSRTFLIELARLLESALPGEAHIRRAGLLGGDSRPVRRIEVDFRDGRDGQNATRYVIEDSGAGALTALRTQVVRGITLKTETIPTEEWIAGVGAGIARQAALSKAARDAMTRLLP